MTRRNKSMDGHDFKPFREVDGITDTGEKWSTRWEKCANCDARRVRRLLWNLQGGVVQDRVDGTAPTPLPATCPI